MRCIDWSDITLDLFVSSVRDAKAKPCFDYSRPVKPGEVIDYFISHSWSDEGEAKFHRLSELASYHRRKYHCFPTFWLDKVCINQSNIGAGLKCLPINIMACRFMLVLNGDTYTNRLWCVWELVRRQLFSFFNPPALLSLPLSLTLPPLHTLLPVHAVFVCHPRVGHQPSQDSPAGLVRRRRYGEAAELRRQRRPLL